MKKILFAALALIFGLPLLVVTVLTDSPPEEEHVPDSGGLSAAVPPQYIDSVMQAGSICDAITPSLIAAQIDTESSWNPLAVSPAGAQEIAQFMPGTWESVGMDGNGDGVIDPFNPADAILSQGHFMCSLYNQVQQYFSEPSLEYTLAAYNAGLGAVQASNGIPPFPETMNYVEVVLSKAATTYSSSVPPTGDVAVVLAWAKSKIGTPYRGYGPPTGCGPTGPNCFDCCGFAKVAYSQIGVDLPLSAPGNPPATAKCEYAMYSRGAQFGGHQVPISEIQPGDLLFFQDKRISPSVDNITHVAIYLGDGQFIDAAYNGVGIRNLHAYDNSMTLLDRAVRIGESK